MTIRENPAARVATDARGPRTSYEDIQVGADLGTTPWSVSSEQIAAICESDDDYHEWYTVGSPFGGVIAPVLIAYPPVRLLFSRAYNVRGLFYELTLDNLDPIRPGKAMFVSGRVVDKWIKRDREYVAYEGECIDEDGLVIFRTRRAHVLDYIPRTAPRSGEGVDSGAAVAPVQPESAARDRSGIPRPEPSRAIEASGPDHGMALALVGPDVPVGWRLPQVSRQMSLRQFRERHPLLYGEHVWPDRNLHADEEAARREGLSAPVASAPTIFALVTRMMMTAFGGGWIQGGALSLKMIKPVYPTDFVTAKGHVTGKIEEPGRQRVHCEVWVENQAREKVVVGRASAAQSRPAGRGGW